MRSQPVTNRHLFFSFFVLEKNTEATFGKVLVIYRDELAVTGASSPI
jgi:hypothetical protein